MLDSAVTAVPQLDGGTEVWIEALPARIYHTPQYGPVEVSPQKLQTMVHNFNKRVRGQDIALDYEHGRDVSKGNQASGWFKEFAVKPSSDDPTQASLWTRVELTDDAAREIKEKKWRYFSLEWDDAWQDNDGNVHPDVVMGGALTNRPIAKKTMPINFSESMWNELDYETKKEFAVWSTAVVNDLPDSCFLYIQPGGNKDSDGKTTPRTLRHFAYKGSDGKIDLPHLRNAIARIPQAKSWLSDGLESTLESRARRLLENAGKAMSEGDTATLERLSKLDFPTYDEVGVELIIDSDAPSDVDITDSGGAGEPTGESKELEHSEPGSGSPPAPRRDEDGSDDPDRSEGWRRPTPPDQGTENPSTSGEFKVEPVTPVTPVTPANNDNDVDPNHMKGGTYVPISQEDEFNLRTILGAGAEGDVVEAARLQLGELQELRQSRSAADQERRFAEEYPAFWTEHNKLMQKNRDSEARMFSESVARVRRAEGFGLKETAKGLSTMALTKIKEVHLAFSEGTADAGQFEDCIRTIVNGGIVDFGEVGTSSSDDVPLIDTSSATGIAGARKLFAEVVTRIQKENPGMSYKDAFDNAAKKHPDLAEAYAVTLPA
jgi:hypothetical protein